MIKCTLQFYNSKSTLPKAQFNSYCWTNQIKSYGGFWEGKTRASGKNYIHEKVKNERKCRFTLYLDQTANLKTSHLCLADFILLLLNTQKDTDTLLPTASWFKYAYWHAYTTLILRTCLISFSHFLLNIKFFYKGEVTGYPVPPTSCTTDFHGLQTKYITLL